MSAYENTLCNREQLESLTQNFLPPFHLYDEASRETARALHQALLGMRV